MSRQNCHLLHVTVLCYLRLSIKQGHSDHHLLLSLTQWTLLASVLFFLLFLHCSPTNCYFLSTDFLDKGILKKSMPFQSFVLGLWHSAVALYRYALTISCIICMFTQDEAVHLYIDKYPTTNKFILYTFISSRTIN